MKLDTKALVFIIIVSTVFIVGLFFLPIPANLDFQVLYFTNLSFINGINIYDYVSRIEFFANLWSVEPSHIFILPFPYPPWYVVFTFFLAWFPPEIASRIWFEINFVLLTLSIWLFTSQWSPKERLFSFFATFLFIPIIGSLYVGQFNFPLLLGIALFIYATQNKNAILIAISFALLTFKPHVGIPLAIILFFHLVNQKTSFSKKSINLILLAALFLFIIGFFTDTAWFINYPRSLASFQEFPERSNCFCASMPISIYYFITGRITVFFSNTIGLLSYFFLVGFVFLLRKKSLLSPIYLINMSILIIMLSSPYFFNYDYILLLIPIFTIIASSLKWKWVWASITYLFPQLLILFLGRDANLFLPLSTLLIFVLFLMFDSKKITSNTNTIFPQN